MEPHRHIVHSRLLSGRNTHIGYNMNAKLCDPDSYRDYVSTSLPAGMCDYVVQKNNLIIKIYNT